MGAQGGQRGGEGGGRAVSVVAEALPCAPRAVVTRVESFGLAADDLAGAFQRKLQTSCSVSKLPGKQEVGSEIMLQGDMARSAAAFLTEQYGVPPSLLEVTSKIKK